MKKTTINTVETNETTARAPRTSKAKTTKADKPTKQLVKKTEKPARKVSTKTAAPAEKAKSTKTAAKRAPAKSEKTKTAPKKTVEKSVKKSATAKAVATKTDTVFPDTLTLATADGNVNLKRAKNLFNSKAEIQAGLDNGESIFIAAYWPREEIKEFDYAEIFEVKQPKAFPDDLDVLTVVATCDIDRIWCMSAYTEAAYKFKSNDCKESKNRDGRYAKDSDLTFEVYTL